jgi:signal transduction histidine kinase
MTQQVSATAALNAAPARILIVDDEAYMCDICARALRAVGYEVVATTSADEAFAELRPEKPFDLLLADIQMPGVSGLELAQRARELDIIMTGHASVENLQQSVRRGIADFLSKPFELEDLRLAVEQALHKRQLLQERIRLRALEQLLQSSEAINAILNRGQLATVILERAIGHVPCRSGFLLLNDDADDPAALLAIPAQWSLSTLGRETALRAYHEGVTILVEGLGPLCEGEGQVVQRALAMPLRAHGEIAGVIMLCDDRLEMLRPSDQDIISLLANQAGTALHNAQLYRQLQDAYQSLQELDRLKSEFIAIASHELRTPLSIVLGYTMMVRDQSDGEQREYVQRVLESAQRIKELVDDMVSLRHLELHETMLAPEPCGLEALLRQAVERMWPAAQEKQQELNITDAAITFMVDREKQLLVLGNLIANAIRFSPERGAITISGALWPKAQLQEATQAAVANSTFRNLHAAPDGQWVVMQVRDPGIGVGRRDQAQIFDRFYQVADSLTREHGGAGLGLALVRDLTDLQGGIVWVDSMLEGGSTFSCAIPYRPAHE